MPGKKGFDKEVRKLGKKNNKTGAIHKMVEALIKGNSDEAAEHLHTYLQIKSREIILGKEDKKDDDKDDDKKDDKKDKKEDKKGAEEDEESSKASKSKKSKKY